MPSAGMYATSQGFSDILSSLIGPVDSLVNEAMSPAERCQIIDSGIVRPHQDEQLSAWLARLLSLRAELWEVIEGVDKLADTRLANLHTVEQWRCFVIGYSAACLLVRIDRFLLFDFADHKLIQRKLNEPFTVYRIPAKQYTAVFVHYTDPVLAFRLYLLIRFRRSHSAKINELQHDDVVGSFVSRLDQFETYLDASKRNFFRRSIDYLKHAFRRRGARARQKTMFAVLEGLGRTASELNFPNTKAIDSSVRQQLSELLQPGDVLITRHRYALTNLFLPGVWPHAALYIGTPAQRAEMNISVDESLLRQWSGDICTFEALKDGVRLRPLAETLAVDGVVVLRPALSKAGIAEGIERVLVHCGKRYNFDFDFFRSDRLVCTELVYRAFDGIEDLHFPLQERAGRQTLSAEDFLNMALDTSAFLVVALFGFPKDRLQILSGEAAEREVAASYRS